jgi:hypothetical protein
MESTNILNKIMTMLSVGKQVNLTGDVYGKLEDGTPLASDAFAVGHQLFVITENGEKVAAPDGDHITYLPTSNGSKRFIIVTKDGTIQAMELNDGHNSIVTKVNYENDPELFKQDTNMVQKQELAAMGPDQPGKMTTNDEAQVVKEMQEKGSVSMAEGDMASRLDSLDAQLKQLRDDVAAIFSHMKNGSEEMKKMEMGEETYNEEAAVRERQAKGSQLQGPVTNAGQTGELPVRMSSKKFTGAPVENNQPALNGLLTHKTQDTFSKVLARMANSKF